MVQHSDVQKAQRLLQAFGDLAVCFAGLRIARRVVVEEDDCGSAKLDSTLCYDSRVDIAPVDGAAEEVLGGQDVVLGVEEDDAENFVTQMCAAGDKVAGGLLGTVDAALPLEAPFEDVGCCEQNALLVHLKLILNCSVLGALHRFVSTSALCASWEPTGEASGPTAPGSEHRGSGAQRRAATERQRREGGLALRIGAAKLRSLSEAQRWWRQHHACPPRLADQAAFGWTG
ncbi:conserved hypothetical protein [Xanthomonas citri pv. citri]|nr:conserved hypothetical protein [Xanthomonas citri pv. citri]